MLLILLPFPVLRDPSLCPIFIWSHAHFIPQGPCSSCFQYSTAPHCTPSPPCLRPAYFSPPPGSPPPMQPCSNLLHLQCCHLALLGVLISTRHWDAFWSEPKPSAFSYPPPALPRCTSWLFMEFVPEISSKLHSLKQWLPTGAAFAPSSLTEGAFGNVWRRFWLLQSGGGRGATVI